MDKLLYTIDESAKMLSVSRSTIYELIKDGELKSIKVGKSHRVTLQAMNEFITSHTTTKEGE